MLYGVDAQKTQAFGNNNGSWDNSFDHGVYGWAIPQPTPKWPTATGA